jgi:transcriptional regulator of acetoin/glycerol metabolism
LAYPWPYNVRELEQTIAAAGVRVAASGRVRLEHLPEAIARVLGSRGQAREPAAPAVPPIQVLVSKDAVPSKDDLLAVIAYFGGKIAQVAEYFGKDRKQIYRWADRYQIDIEALRRE